MLEPAYITLTGMDESDIQHSNIPIEKLQCIAEGRKFSRVEDDNVGGETDKVLINGKYYIPRLIIPG